MDGSLGRCCVGRVYGADGAVHGTIRGSTVIKVLCYKSEGRVAGFSLQHGYHSNPTTPKVQHTSNQEQYDQCGNSTE